MAVPAFSIVEALDVLEHIGACFVSSPVAGAVDSFPLQQPEETLDNRVVIAVATATHAALDAVLLKLVAKVVTRILGAADALMFVKWQ